MDRKKFFPDPGEDPFKFYDSDDMFNYPTSDTELPDESIFISLNNNSNNSDENSLDNLVPPSPNQMKKNYQPSRKRRLGNKKNNIFRMEQKRPCYGKVEISKEAVEFQENLYKMFTKRRKFKKIYVKEIHDKILVDQFGFEKMSRAEYRNNSIYFNNYARMSLKILGFLEKEKDSIQKKIFANNY